MIIKTNTHFTKLAKTPFEHSMRYVFLCSAWVSILITVSIIVILVTRSIGFFREVSIFEFLTTKEWNPTIKPYRYGILPLISGTFIFTIITALLALPLGLCAAVYLSEYAHKTVRKIVKPMLELLAGLPTVVYGYFALVYITPFLRTFIPAIDTFNVLSAAIVVAIMIIPTIASLSEDAMRAVPSSLREASYALGARKYQTCTRTVIPAALSGILSSFILGISRAIGETMAVTIAAGNFARIVNIFDMESTLLKPIQTMTAAMVEIGISDVTGDSVAYKSLFAIGITLFIITLIMNTISQIFKAKFREVYH